jgi:hypothetical protein
MPLVPRTLPTRLGSEDKLIDVYLFSLTVFQVLNILGGLAVASELLNGPALGLAPTSVRQVLAALAVGVAVLAAFWRRDGKSVWSWLLVALRFGRLPRRAISRPAVVTLGEGPDNYWYEVQPPLVWCDRQSEHVTKRVLQ